MRIRSEQLYWRYLLIMLKSQLQYRASFLMLAFGQLLVPLSVFAGLYLLFERFGQLQGWQFAEVALCFAIIHMAFALAECFARGFDSFSQLVVRGDFDRLLVRPRGTVLQVLGSKFEFSLIGRLVQSAAVLGWALSQLHIEWTALKVLCLVLMVLGGTLIFAGIFILAATLCFWTIQGLEVTNIFTDGGREMAQYPINIYERWVIRLFTFVIPFAAVNYVPLLYLLDKTEGANDGVAALLYPLIPLAGVLFLVPCLLLWHFGVRHYRSTGS